MSATQRIFLNLAILLFGFGGGIVLSLLIPISPLLKHYVFIITGMISLLIAGYCAGYSWARTFPSNANEKLDVGVLRVPCKGNGYQRDLSARGYPGKRSVPTPFLILHEYMETSAIVVTFALRVRCGS